MNDRLRHGRRAIGVSCIIPAYNEAKRIGAVLSAVTSHPLIDEVIVVDDGSTDGTALVAGGFDGVVLVRLPANGGKSRAVGAGLQRASGRYLLLVDADLAGLRADDLTRLIVPVVNDNADITVSLRRNAPWLWRRIGIDYISGERVIPVELIAGRIAELENLPRFGFEIWLNRICVASRSRIAVVEWAGVDSPIKVRKHGLLRGILADAGMMRDLFGLSSPLRMIRLIVSMRRLRVPPSSRSRAS